MTWCIIANGRHYISGLEKAVSIGGHLLENGENAIDAVQETIRILEDDPHFDAGTGCDLNLHGLILMDASIMDGKSLRGGAVGAVSGIKNPILLARKVMDYTPNVLIVGKYAEDFAEILSKKHPEIITNFDARTDETKKKFRNILKILIEEELVEELLSETDSTSEIMYNLLLKNKLSIINQRVKNISEHGTVSVTALDQNGNFAAGSSTGGWTMALPGRIGDSPLIGCGAYADNEKGGSSTSGIRGEENIRLGGLTRRVCDLMEMGRSSCEATQEVSVYAHKKLNFKIRTGSLIAIDTEGNPGYNLTQEAPSQGVVYMKCGMIKPTHLT